jgi:DEAD/DEAH box helicase domain-containing protein
VTLTGGAAEIVAHYHGAGSARWATSIPSRDPILVDVPTDLPSDLGAALDALDRRRLYVHQRQTIEQVRLGKDVLLVTSTASGKTLAFNGAILDTLLREPSGRALYLYPLNALVNDQKQGIEALVSRLPEAVRPRVGLVTGQADASQKKAARDAQLILTNPETVHFSILQHPTLWRTALSQLRFIVIDEAHMYRGAFGAHVAHVIRRLLRLAQAAGSRPQLIAASATIGNPLELGRLLTGRDFVLIDQDGSARPERQLVAWEPPVFGDRRGGTEDEAVSLLVAALDAGRSVILFARSRRGVESLTSEVHERLPSSMRRRVRPYRGGFTTAERREIEDGLRSGDIRAVVSTNALEVGIDIGALDVVIISGYPGSMMAFWQQAGRAGRRGRTSQIFYVPSANPLDEYFAATPDRLLGTPHELASADPWNPRVAVDHVLWRAQEFPIRASGPWESVAAKEITDRLVRAGALVPKGNSLVIAAPHDYEVSIRSVEGKPFHVIDPQGRHIGEVDEAYLYRECHVGAIYVHSGRAHRVLALEESDRRVMVAEAEAWTRETKVVVQTAIATTSPISRGTFGVGPDGWDIHLVSLDVTETFLEYLEYPRRRPRDATPYPISPPLVRTRPTVGVIIKLPMTVRPEAAHAIEHALLSMVPTEVMCDRRDFLGLTEGIGPSTITLYDRNLHGLGFAERAFERLPAIVAAAADRVASCDCDDGCPLCIQSGACDRWNNDLDKTEASLALDATVGLKRERRQVPRIQPVRQAAAMSQVARAVADVMVAEQRASYGRDETAGAATVSWRSDQGLSLADLSRGLTVKHTAFGTGTVVETKRDSTGFAVHIRFERLGPKWVIGGRGYLMIQVPA